MGADREGDRAFWGLFGLYCLAAISRGFAYFTVFFSLTFVTCLGLIMNRRSESALRQLGSRSGQTASGCAAPCCTR